MDKAARAALLTAKGTNKKRAGYALSGGVPPKPAVKNPTLQEAYFAGPEAKTFNQIPEERKFDDPSGMRRFEGSDNKASSPIKSMSDYHALLRRAGPRMEGDPAATLSGTTVPLSQLLNHDELYRDYPQLMDTPVFVKPPSQDGSVASYSDAESLASDGANMFYEIANPDFFTGKYNINNERDRDSVYNNVFNSPTGAFTIDNPEGQHFTPTYLQNKASNDFSDKFLRMLVHEAQHAINSIDKTNKLGSTPENYEGRPTEMEAFFTADRINMTPEQRAAEAHKMNKLFLDNAMYASGGAVSKSKGGALDLARAVMAKDRAGGQIAPSKYLPNVPRQVHAGGGRVGYEDGGDVSGTEPKNTVKAYKLFKRKKDGNIYPLFVNANKPVPIGQWLDAEEGPQGKSEGKVKSSLGDLAYRPGWHAGDLPVATHIGGKSKKELTAPDYRPDDHVWAEVEMPNDVDWQSVANSRMRRTADGRPILNTAHITDQLPKGGFYRYKTNPNMTGNWLIGGSMKVNRILHDDEVKQINDSAGTADLPRMPDITKAGGGAATAPMFQGIHPDLQGEGGSPLDLYHGTGQDEEFEAFDNAKLGARDAGFYGRGHYLTPVKGNAEGYADPDEMGKGTVIGPLHAALKNPYVWDVSNDMKAHSTLRDLQSMGIMREKDELNSWDNLQQHHIKPFMAEMQKRGHDGVMVKTGNEDMPNGISEVVAFNPNTIKHKDAEVFDPNDPRIRREDGGEVDGITAYHGSPHSFDQFDISKLGTGEGAQAYGHGLYFAGNEKIAKHYRDTLSDNQGMVDAAIKRFGGIDGAIGEMKKVINDYQNGVYADPNGLQSTKKRLEQLERQKSGELNKGHMYKVKLNVKPHELLDWDKPLSEQHPNVQAAIKATGVDTGARKWENGADMGNGSRLVVTPHPDLPDEEEFAKYEMQLPSGSRVRLNRNDVARVLGDENLQPNGLTGAQIHQRLVDMGNRHGAIGEHLRAGNPMKRGDKWASEALMEQGLKGIRYLDASSRGNDTDGDPTHNYVMFHHDPVQVVDKYEYGGTVGKEEGGEVEQMEQPANGMHMLRMRRAGINTKEDFWNRWRDHMRAKAGPNTALSMIGSKESHFQQIDNLLKFHRQSADESGIRSVLQRYGQNGQNREDGSMAASMPKAILQSAGIEPTVDNASQIYHSLPDDESGRVGKAGGGEMEGVEVNNQNGVSNVGTQNQVGIAPFNPAPRAQAGELPNAGGVRGGSGVLSAPHEAPLEGLLTPVKIPMTGQVIHAGPDPRVRQVARDYMASTGMAYNPPKKYARVDPSRSERISDAYEAMKDNSSDPLTKASYDAMIKETMAQYRAAKAAGFKAEFWNPQTEEDPYHASPRLATEDIRNNHHMFVYPTEDGYGSDGPITEEQIKKNPMLQPSGETWNGIPVTVNDIFRAVHDYFGHAKEGVGFRDDGEENAWRAHASMFSPLARMAMTTETRGQNSWLNYNPVSGEKNRKARTEDSTFATQKVGVLPHWVHHEGAEDFMGPEEVNAMAAIRKVHGRASGGAVDAALALTRRFTKDGTGATLALKPKGK